MTPSITVRKYSNNISQELENQGISPLFARLYAARGITDISQINTKLNQLLPFTQLKDAQRAAALLADAIARQEYILVVADYDCDGATACAVAIRGLRLFGAHIDYLVPNRLKMGYGLTPEIVEFAAKRHPRWIITVDNGIASVEGVDKAHQLGINVIITDHHLPNTTLPKADAIVNPNQTDCTFPSKNLSGVGVVFYLLLALRSELRNRGAFSNQPEPRLDQLLDLVALGTIADVVPLDQNNRILVSQGLTRIRSQATKPGIIVLFSIANRNLQQACCNDLGYCIAPRLNAAGRLEDMSLGIECLLTDCLDNAWQLAEKLNHFNHKRKQLQQTIYQEALSAFTQQTPPQKAYYSIVLFQENWHQGIVDIVAGQLKKHFYRPVFVFAPYYQNPSLLKGSGRSIAQFHLKNALELISKRYPSILLQFGGHAMAAGVTIHRSQLRTFQEALESIARQSLDSKKLQQYIETDGSLANDQIDLTLVKALEYSVWGQDFPAPIFADQFKVIKQKVLQDKHLKLTLAHNQQYFQAILFNHTQALTPSIYAAYQIKQIFYKGKPNFQLTLYHVDNIY